MKRKNFTTANFTDRHARLALLIAAAGCPAFAPALQAQEALRQSLIGERSALARSRRDGEQHYNMKLGQVGLNFDASLEAEYNDNINVSTANAQEDVVLRPHLGLRSKWQVTQYNALDLNLGLSYSHYIDHPRYNRFLVTPDSELSFDVFVKDYRINFHDRISYVQNAIEEGSVSGDTASAQHTALFGGLSNTAGVEVGRNLGRLNYAVGYDHATFQASSSYWERQDKSSELFFARARWAFNEAVAGGPEFTGALNNYEKKILNDSTSYTAGVFADWKLTSKIQATARAGYVAYDFDSVGSVGQTKNVSSFYGSLSLQHTINQYLAHSIAGTRESRLGLYADALSVYDLRYAVNLSLIRHVPMSAQVIYEQASDNRLQGRETYDRVGFTFDTQYQLTRKTALKLTYRYYTKDSSTLDRNYSQNAIFLTALYHF